MLQKGVETVLQPILKFIVAAILVAVAIAVLVTILIERGKRHKIQKEADASINDLGTKLQLSQAALESQRSSTEQQLKTKDELFAQMAKNYEKNLDDIRASHKEALKAQAESLKAELTAQTEQQIGRAHV